MRVRVVKWLCIAVLFVAFVLWQGIANYSLTFRTVVCSGAAILALHALDGNKHRRAICLFAIAVLFSPAIPVLRLANQLGLVAIVLADAVFLVLLTSLKSLPLPSIAGRDPGSEWL